MKRIEYFLTKKYANKYNLRRYGLHWLWIETNGLEDAISRQFDEDISHYNTFRKEIGDALSKYLNKRLAVTEEWVFFLKPRIERLEFWCSLCNAISALIVAGFGLFAIVGTVPGDALSSSGWIAIGLIISVIIGLYRFNIERKKLWYKYVLSHLEAIIKTETRKLKD